MHERRWKWKGKLTTKGWEGKEAREIVRTTGWKRGDRVREITIGRPARKDRATLWIYFNKNQWMIMSLLSRKSIRRSVFIIVRSYIHSNDSVFPFEPSIVSVQPVCFCVQASVAPCCVYAALGLGRPRTTSRNIFRRNSHPLDWIELFSRLFMDECVRSAPLKSHTVRMRQRLKFTHRLEWRRRSRKKLLWTKSWWSIHWIGIIFRWTSLCRRDLINETKPTLRQSVNNKNCFSQFIFSFVRFISFRPMFFLPLIVGFPFVQILFDDFPGLGRPVLYVISLYTLCFSFEFKCIKPHRIRSLFRSSYAIVFATVCVCMCVCMGAHVCGLEEKDEYVLIISTKIPHREASLILKYLDFQVNLWQFSMWNNIRWKWQHLNACPRVCGADGLRIENGTMKWYLLQFPEFSAI